MFEQTEEREALYCMTSIAVLLLPLDCHAELETWPCVRISMPCLALVQVISNRWHSVTSSLPTFALVNSIFLVSVRMVAWVWKARKYFQGINRQRLLLRVKLHWVWQLVVFLLFFFELPQISWKSKSDSFRRTIAPFLCGFLASSPSVNRLCVVFPPKNLALLIRLSLIAQKYEPVVIHPNGNVSGAYGKERIRVAKCGLQCAAQTVRWN